MNILPKKRWHVRTRENIARVRKDEAAAAEEEKKRIERIELAEKEARTELLREQARAKYGCVPKKEEDIIPKPEVNLVDNSGHVNLFYELNDNSVVSNRKNEEHEKEAKEEREKEEMKIGYLTYLGQDTNELTGSVSWYNKAPVRAKVDDDEIGLKEKHRQDPLKDIRKYLESDGIKAAIKTSTTSHSSTPARGSIEPPSKKHKDKKKKRKKDEKVRKLTKKKEKKKKHRKEKSKKKRKQSSSSDDVHEKKRPHSVDIEKLRAERVEREKRERQRTADLMARLRGDLDPPKEAKESTTEVVVQKYNSQFNPFLARQNYNKE